MIDPERKQKLRKAVRYFYDLQKLRIQASNRDTRQAEHAIAVLDEHDKDFLGRQGDGIKALEKDALKEVRRLLKGIPIYEKWLKDQRGIGPTLSGVLLSEIDITRDETVSCLWSYAGLAVDQETGKALRLQRGKKCTWNPFLKAKLLKVMSDCLIKANSPWRKYYDDYKTRKKNQLVDECMACKGTGKVAFKEQPDGKGTAKKPVKKVCNNCKGKIKGVPWGCSDAHRHSAACRYMVKMFLLELWKKWRTEEGLPTPNIYAEVYLNRGHGTHGGQVSAQAQP